MDKRKTKRKTRTRKKESMKVISIRLPQEMIKKLDEVAERELLDRSDIIRRALAKILYMKEGPQAY